MGNQIHLNIIIHGHVQGVGFRCATQKRAKSLNIKGIVKNLNDGTVYIEAEGNRTAINEFLLWCSKGPPRSKVIDISSDESEVKGFNDFGINF